MFTAYLSFSLIMGIFMSYIWSSNGFQNTIIKMIFTLYSLWTAALLVGYAWPQIQAMIPSARLF